MPLVDQHDAFRIAVAHQKAGRLREAEALYLQILARSPDHADALHNRSLIASQVGRHDMAVELLRQAIEASPNSASFYNALGNALIHDGKPEQAITAYHTALLIDPAFAQAHSNMGKAMKDQGKLADAIASYRQAIRLEPKLYQTHNNLGNALFDNGQTREAISAFRQAVELEPRQVQSHVSLAAALLQAGQIDEAIEAYRRLIALQPNHASAHNNLGNALGAKGAIDESIESHRKAISLAPHMFEAHANLARSLRSIKRFAEAAASFREAARLRPESAEVQFDLGETLRDNGDFEAAIAAYRHAIARKPDWSIAHIALGSCYMKLDRLDEAGEEFRQAIAIDANSAAAYSNLGDVLFAQGKIQDAIAADRKAIEIDPQIPELHSRLLMKLHYLPGIKPGEIAAEHRRWNEQYVLPSIPQATAWSLGDRHHNALDPGRPLRIGYVSPDFRANVIGWFCDSLFTRHNRENFAIFGYANVRHPDDTTHKLITASDGWHDISNLDDHAAADLIRADHIDILVDLSLHSPGNRLLVFARKPAPVQISYLRYAGSSGLGAMDYRLTDPYLDPPGTDESVYSEKSLRLPETYWCYTPPHEAMIAPSPARSDQPITFGCLNDFCKVNSDQLALWAQVLRMVPTSGLILHAPAGEPRGRVLAVLSANGVDGARISFVPRVSLADYFQQYHRIDIALDTAPFSGGMTTCDALWMGVPVVSISGQTASSRAGSSILNNVGLPELATRSPEQFVKAAVALAQNQSRLEHLHATLRERLRSSPLMDMGRLAHNIESIYRQAWRSWCAQSAACPR